MSHPCPAPETVPLQNAVLCVDCELVSASRSDVCPVCGGHSLLNLASMMGGTLIDCKENRFRRRQFPLFDLDVSIAITQVEAGELSAFIEGISRLIAPKLGRETASFHVNVQPVSKPVTVLKAA